MRPPGLPFAPRQARLHVVQRGGESNTKSYSSARDSLEYEGNGYVAQSLEDEAFDSRGPCDLSAWDDALQEHGKDKM